MSRTAKSPSGAAGRVAASRRARWNANDDDNAPPRKAGKSAPRSSAKAGKGGKGKGKASAPSSTIGRIFKFAMLMVFMAVIGFIGVLALDGIGPWVGSMRMGQTTAGALWDKVVDRVLDRDVPPRAPPKAGKPTTTAHASATPHPTTNAAPTPPPAADTPRAPLPAPRPDEYARHVDGTPDPEVQAARARLDALLKRL